MTNVVELCGTLTVDPELHDLVSGSLMEEFTLAVKFVRWDRDAGCDVIEQIFARVCAWDDVAETIAGLSKGACVHVRGQLSQREIVGRDGKKDRKTRVHALVVNVVRTPSGSGY